MPSPREIVLDAFSLKKPERIPVGVCLGGSWPFFVERVALSDLFNDPRRAAEIFYAVNERVGADFITVGTGATALIIEALGGTVEFPPNGAPEILSIAANSRDGEDNIDDLDIGKVFRSERVGWLKAVAEETVRLNRGRRGIFVSGRAPFTLAGQLCGIETFSRALYKNKTFAERLLNFTAELSAAYYEFMLGAEGIDGVFIADPIASGDVLSKKHFELEVLPRLTALTSRLSRHGKPSLLHICGNITDRLELLPQTGIDMISLDAKVDLKRASEILRGKMGIAGNVNPVSVLEEGTPEESAAAARKCIGDVAGNGGFMLLPGCDISYHTPEANIAAFVKAAHEYHGT
jgi:uroporphyrinogen decarboxylase